MTGAALTSVLDALDYRADEGLVTSDTPEVGGGRAYVWQEIRDKLQIDAAYFHGNVPAVYFKELSTVDDDYLWDLHRSLWNHNRAPLLIAVLPREVRVYNCFAPPTRRSDQLTLDNPALLKQALHQATNALALRQELSEYRRREIVSGRFVQTQRGRFDRRQRVDNRLLENLRHLRRQLIKTDGLSAQVVNGLLGRSIFVRYLEDRGVITQDYYGQFGSGRSFHAILRESLDATYQLFDALARRFNGDLFPVDALEREEVKPEHLQRLGRFLDGEEVSSGQLYFWAYDFKYIPIELISAIYETFLDEDRENHSAYYTPPEVVDFVLNEVLPDDADPQDIKILDPACGSGIFLVEAYRRLVTLRRHAHDDRNLSFDELSDLLTTSINGVDLSEDAIQVAAFSCYLALLDFLEPKSIWEGVRLPSLKGANLFVSDFFDPDAPFNEQRYDVIIGNPPWKSQLTEPAADYIQRNGYTIGDKQIAQAFLWRAPALLTEAGRVCLLAPSKGVLFNQSGPHREFRRSFFAANQVTQVVDFSAFRRSLFREAVAPMVAVFFEGELSGHSEGDGLTYVGPHPSPLAQGLAGIVVFGDEVKRIPRAQASSHPYIWKVALWGTPRDLRVLDDLAERFPSLAEVGQSRGWVIREGITVNGRSSNHAPELARIRYVPASAVQPFHVSSSQEERIDREVFHRPGDVRAYRGPHTLLRGGAITGGVLAAAFLPDDAVFKDGVIGIAGPRDDTNYLKVACAYVNSSLARYYQFLTASTWGVERDVVRLTEHKRLPCAIPVEDADLLDSIVALVDRVQRPVIGGDWRRELDELVYRAYGVTSSERQTIEDLLGIAVDRHYRGLQGTGFETPSADDLIAYAQAYTDVFETSTGGNRALRPVVYVGSPPYRAVSFRLAPSGADGRRPQLASEPELEQLLVELERVATEQHGRSLYFRRNIKVYEPEAIHVVKPAERRFWTRSAGYNDADETIAQLLRTLAPSRDGRAERTI
ncbi:MAG: N-6 DNA methylase [Chloroflexi bacterium]|nr:N-6 DNA methylase [Chloroflexota bacterium]